MLETFYCHYLGDTSFRNNWIESGDFQWMKDDSFRALSLLLYDERARYWRPSGFPVCRYLGLAVLLNEDSVVSAAGYLTPTWYKAIERR